MPFLDAYTGVLTAEQAAHLLRRATIGPTPPQIAAFTGLTAQQAVDQLAANSPGQVALPEPIELSETKPNFGQTYLDKPFNSDRNYAFGHYYRFVWLGRMADPTAPPSLLEKLALFWQNHFVTTRTVVDDYRFVIRYVRLIRSQALGNFRSFVVEITKDPAMLRYLNGHENEALKPNENYARELQELFTVGEKDFQGNKNYTEDDVKAMARVLSGWKHRNYRKATSTTVESYFEPTKHDTTSKTLSGYYNNAVIAGRSGPDAGEQELQELVTILLNHPQTPRFICRKLYGWYVNPNVTADVEEHVIGPLAAFFKAGGYAIEPVVKKLLASEIFFAEENRGAIIKSPVDLVVGTVRFFEQPVPDMVAEPVPFRIMMDFLEYRLSRLQMQLLDQPSVFGYVPYYQTGYSRNWINTSSIALRNEFVDAIVGRWLTVRPDYKLGFDTLARLTALQPNFSDVPGTPPITAEAVYNAFTRNLFTRPLSEAQKNFLIDTILMKGIPRTSWLTEWNNYRTNPTDTNRQNAVRWRGQNLMLYLLKMAEYYLL